jgi:hypothetical protein
VPRYFLHIDVVDTDPEGTEFIDLATARAEAILAARELLAECLLVGRDTVALKILIADETGQVLDNVHTRDVLPSALRDKSSP